jgi:hypothetical protein
MKSISILPAVVLVSTLSSAVAISITGFGTPYSQDFNTLASSGTSSTMPADWFFSEALGNANTSYTAGTGSSATGDTYSFGSTAAADRALGGLRSGTLAPTFGVVFQNNAGSLISSLQISYTGEQWRLGASGRGADRLDFQYSFDATSLTTGIWIDANGLDFSSPVTVGTVGALDGNNALNRSLLSATLSGLSWSAGTPMWIRWTDFDVSNADDGLAVDDFSIVAPQTAQSIPESLPRGAEIIALLGLLIGGWFVTRTFPVSPATIPLRRKNRRTSR